MKLEPRFVDEIPLALEDGVLYMAMEVGAVVHNCVCGCKSRTVTPLSPTDYRLTYDGESVSLWPSVGNWEFDCESHYWIRNNEIQWAGDMSNEQIAAGREADRAVKLRRELAMSAKPEAPSATISEEAGWYSSVINRLKSLLGGKR